MPEAVFRMSGRTEVLLGFYSRGDPARCLARAMKLGLEFMWTPAIDFARITQAHTTHAGASRSWFLNSGQRLKFLTLEGDQMIPADWHRDIPARTFNRGVRVMNAHELDYKDGWTLALRYGLVAYKCRLKTLRESLGAYGKDLKVPTKMLNDGKTYAGQAHLGETGPDAFHCRDCLHFDAKANLRGPATQGRCGVWAELMGVSLKRAPLFPVAARTCKYFEEKPK